MKIHLLSFAISWTLPILILCNRYRITFDDEDVLKPCADFPNNYVSSWMDISHLTFEYTDDEQIVAKGYIEPVISFKPNDTLYIDVEIIRKTWGNHKIPVAEVKRYDLCKSLFDPNEIWYGYTSMIDPENRECPLVKGVQYHMGQWKSEEYELNLPDPGLTGAYRIISTVGVNYDRNNFYCVSSDIHLYKQ